MIARLVKGYITAPEKWSDLLMVDCGEIEVIVRSLALDPNMGVIHDRHCSIVQLQGSQSF